MVVSGEIVVFGLLIIVLIGVIYVYWRSVKGYLSSVFRAYDLIIASFLLYLVVARIGGLLMGLGVDYDQIQLEQLFTFTGIRFEYLTALYVPLLVFQFFNTNLEVKDDWYRKAVYPVSFGAAVSGVLLIINLLISLNNQTGDQNDAFFLVTGITLLLAASLFVYLIMTDRVSNQLSMLSLLLVSIVVQLSIWLISGYSVAEVSVMSVLHLFLLTIAFLPHIYVEFRLRRERQELARRRLPVPAI